jgi:acyl-CoA thioester hydrolase
MSDNTSIWVSEVRDYEVDFQGIVNNAIYFHYLAQARALHLEKMGFDIVKANIEGIKAVLIESNIKFLKPLKYKDIFLVKTHLKRISKLRFLFIQEILNKNTNEICVKSENLTCCVLSKNNKPIVPQILGAILVE